MYLILLSHDEMGGQYATLRIDDTVHK